MRGARLAVAGGAVRRRGVAAPYHGAARAAPMLHAEAAARTGLAVPAAARHAVMAHRVPLQFMPRRPPLARIQIDRMPPSSISAWPPAADLRRSAPARFSCDLFQLRLFPLLNLEPPAYVRRTPPSLGAPWLPFPPKRSTHKGSNVRRAAAAAMAAHIPEPVMTVGSNVRGADAARIPLLMLRTTVYVSKRRVHKLAVVRNRCRTRLIAALRQVLAEGGVLVRPRMVYIFSAGPQLYGEDMASLCRTMRNALGHVARTAAPPKQRLNIGEPRRPPA